MKHPVQSVLVYRTLNSDKEIESEEILETKIELYEASEEDSSRVDLECVEEKVSRDFYLSRDEKWAVKQQNIAADKAVIVVYVQTFN